MDLVFFDTTSIYFEGRGGDLPGRRGNSKDHRPDPAPLKLKEVWVEKRRYVVCLNEEEAQADALSRQAIVESLREKLKRGDKALVGNQSHRRYLTATGKGFRIDEAKIEQESRYDGKWVLHTNTQLVPEEVDLRYKQLWRVEEMIRSVKSILRTRPVYHKRDATIRGHVFCSFLALLLRTGLERRLEEAGHKLEWADVVRDLDRLEEIEVELDGKRFLLRTEAAGVAGRVFQAVGVASPPTVRRVETLTETPTG